MIVFIIAWLLVFSLWVMYINERSRSTHTWWLSRDMPRDFDPRMSDAQYSKTLTFGEFKTCMWEMFELKPYRRIKEKPKFHEPGIATGIFGVTSIVIFYLFWTKPAY